MFSRKSEGFSEQDLEELDVLVARMRMHMLELFALRRDLKHIDQGIPTHKRIDKLFNGHKHHLCEHLISLSDGLAPKKTLTHSDPSVITFI
jgi:hypothetical protein